MEFINTSLLSQKEVFREKEVIKIFGKSRSSIWRDEKEGRFPRRVKIGVRAVGWLRSSLESHLRGLKEQESAQSSDQAGQ